MQFSLFSAVSLRLLILSNSLKAEKPVGSWKLEGGEGKLSKFNAGHNGAATHPKVSPTASRSGGEQLLRVFRFFGLMQTGNA